MVDVVVADDHRLVRQGLRSIFREAPDIQVVAEAATGEQVLEIAREQPPDVVLMDLQMPGMGGIEATRRLHKLNRRIRVIVLTVYDAGPYPHQALRAGGMGFLDKGCDKEEVIDAVRTVHLGRRYIRPEIAQQVALSQLDGSGENPFEGLTQREFEVLMRVLNGQSGTAIAEALCLSPKTVSTYRSRLFEHLGVGSDAELVRLAIDYGMVGAVERS